MKEVDEFGQFDVGIVFCLIVVADKELKEVVPHICKFLIGLFQAGGER